jgi:hypothetical protein
MRFIDDIGNAISRVANEVGYMVTMMLGTLSNIEPEEIRLMPNPKVLENMVAEAAYYRADHRGFAAGYELCDWLEAEKEILAGLHLNY